MVVFINDRFVDEKQATLGVADLSIQRGYGIFDYFRTRSSVPLFIDDYLDRFFRSARLLRFPMTRSREEIKSIIAEMMARNGSMDSGFKMILTGGYSADGYEPANPNFIVLQQPVEVATKEHFTKGIKIILHEYLRDLPAVKSINYLMAIYLRDRLKENNADDILYYKNNSVLEFPRSNVFIVTKDQTVVTADENVLHGITRKKVLEVAGKKFKVEERNVTVEELKNAAEVFLTSSTKRLLPVLEIDNTPVGNGEPGEVTTSLYNSFLQLEEQYCSSHAVLAKSEVL